MLSHLLEAVRSSGAQGLGRFRAPRPCFEPEPLERQAEGACSRSRPSPFRALRALAFSWLAQRGVPSGETRYGSRVHTRSQRAPRLGTSFVAPFLSPSPFGSRAWFWRAPFLSPGLGRFRAPRNCFEPEPLEWQAERACSRSRPSPFGALRNRLLRACRQQYRCVVAWPAPLLA